MAKNQGAPPPSRTAKRPSGSGKVAVSVSGKSPAQSAATQSAASKAAAARPATPKKPFNLPQFLREVRAEARKITWTPWKETWITSVMVFIMVALTAAFFALLDGGLNIFIQQILKLAA